ncbi:MAG: hypothetical protein AB1745_26725 [Pseudomonadota bacterium]
MAKSGISKMRLRPRATAGASPALPLAAAAKSKSAERNRAATAPLRPSDPEFWTVINEIADPTPIAPAELDAIERYFSAVLDDVFAASRKTSP